MLVEKSMHPDWLSNAFVVAAEGGPAVFVDSGADVAPLIAAVERWGVTPVALLRTHGHHDHVENEDELAGRYSIPVLAEPGEWSWDRLHVKALATPGHSDDGLSFVFGEDVVATGDTLFRDAVGVGGGTEPEGSERVRVGGRDATLIVWSPDYDGNGKAWVRFDDGEEATVGGSRVERNA